MTKENSLNDELKDINIDFDIPVEGSLGLLAFGHIGLQLWRNKRREVAKQKQKEKNSSVNDE